ncbi:MAG: putative enzyme of heme biosynthesis [Rhodocyclaceae bacterium]|nr:putative enzyme of heme biosynthesis [Rhodocyclaceae bacterium]
MNDAPPPTEITVAPVRSTAAPVWRNPWFYLVLMAVGLALWQWVETRIRLADTQQEVARRLADNAAASKEDRSLLKESQEQVAALQDRVDTLESQQAEFQGQAQELRNLYQDLARSRDDATLLEVEQAVTLAAQQLQLAGNVQAAVLALQSADAKLARLDRPQFIPLRKTLARDLERLQALPFVDLPGMSVKLESAIVAVDKLPLAMDQRPRSPEKPAAAQPAATELPWWKRAGSELWQEVRGLVRIQRFDRAEPVLLPPEQSFFLRENLKLRLLNARLALFARDAWTFRNELRAAQDWLARYFDGQDKAVQAEIATLRQLAAAEVNIEPPSLNDSLTALRIFKSARERK